MRRGEIWLGDLNPNRSAEVGKIQPVLIVQADFLIAGRPDDRRAAVDEPGEGIQGAVARDDRRSRRS
jgi:hypothetical protein